MYVFLAFSMNVGLKVMNNLVCTKTMTKFTFRRNKNSKLSLLLPLKWVRDF